MKKCKECGAKLINPLPRQRLCEDCKSPKNRKKNHEDLIKLYADIKRKKQPPKPRSGMSIDDIAKLDEMSHRKLGYGKIQERYGDLGLTAATLMMKKEGLI